MGAGHAHDDGGHARHLALTERESGSESRSRLHGVLPFWLMQKEAEFCSGTS